MLVRIHNNRYINTDKITQMIPKVTLDKKSLTFNTSIIIKMGKQDKVIIPVYNYIADKDKSTEEDLDNLRIKALDDIFNECDKWARIINNIDEKTEDNIIDMCKDWQFCTHYIEDFK